MRPLELSLTFLVALLIVLALPSPAGSQPAVPVLVNYQGELRSPTTGESFPNGSYDMVFKIYDVQSAGTPLWEGTHSTANANPVPVEGGIFSVILGSGAGNALGASLFGDADRWLEITVGTETLSPRQRITSVAYSLVCENSRLFAGRGVTEFANSTHAHSGSEITSGTVSEAWIDPLITRDTEKDAAIAAHAAISNAHHARYTDAEAVVAMGAKSPNNPLNHDKTTKFTELTDVASDAQIPAGVARDAEVDSKITAHAGIPGAHHTKTTTFGELTDTASDAQIPAAIARDSEVTSGIATHAAIADAHHARYTDPEAVSAMGLKSNTNPLHHDKTTKFSDLTDTATDAQIPNNITINYAASAGDADTVDGAHAAALEESAEIDSDIVAHAGISDAHHTRYTNSEAVAAMGAKANANPLNHDKTTAFPELTGAATDAQIPATIARDAEVDSKITAHTAIASAHHVKTTTFTELTGTASDAQIPATIARDSEVTSQIGTHAAIADAHHTRYTDTEAVAAMGAKANTNPLNHDKTTTFSQLTGTLSDGQIPASIARDSEIMPTVLAGDGPGSTLNADLLDGMEGAALEESAEIDSDIAAHKAIADAHHAKYTNAEAVAAMGAKADSNPLNHDKTAKFTELTDVAADAQIAASIARDSEIMPTVLAGDGPGSTLNADYLDGNDSSAFALSAHTHDASAIVTGSLANARFSAYGDLTAEGYLDNNAATDLLTRTQGDSRYWGLTGNTGTNPVTHFLGTADNTAVELRVNNARAIRLEPNATSPNLIGGYSGNTVTSGVLGAAIGGGGQTGYENRVTDDYGTIGGGEGNQTNAAWATVGGGVSNIASWQYATVGGGGANQASGVFATVAGGENNHAIGYSATVGGGSWNEASAAYATIAGGGPSDPTLPLTCNRVTDDYGTIGGGGRNQAGDYGGTTDAQYATVGGGYSNEATGEGATVAGGWDNTASADYATVGGGQYNEATDLQATVAGGWNNTASYASATVGGGEWNTASGFCATVPGGDSNTAQGDYSFAAGRQAKANHSGSFVWADSTAADFLSLRDNQFRIRANGGAAFEVNGAWVDIWVTAGRAIRTSTGAYLSTGGAWTDFSNRDGKENFLPVDAEEVLSRLASLPINTWNYKEEDGSIRHMGPVAQDFYGAFGLGQDDEHIASLDTSGVSLAAIQGLHEMLREKGAEIAAIKNQNAELQQRLSALEKLFEKFSQDR